MNARSVSFVADMRYRGQGYEIPVAIDPGELRTDGLAQLDARFNALHEQLYGFRMHETRSEIVNLRAVGFGAAPKPELPQGEVSGDGAEGAVVDTHEIVFRGGRVPTQIYDRAQLKPGARFTGPAIVREELATTLVCPGQVASVGRFGEIVIEAAA